MFLQMERDKYFSSLSYSICEGQNCFFSSETQKKKKICQMVRKKSYLSPLLKNGHSQITLELKPRMGELCLLYANIALKWQGQGKFKNNYHETVLGYF